MFFKLNFAATTQQTMEISHSRSFGLLRSTLCLLLLGLIVPSQALYFYLEGTTPKCFYEELPKDTLVVGEHETFTTFPYALFGAYQDP